MILGDSGEHIGTQYVVLMVGLAGQIITVLCALFGAGKITHSKKKGIREQISCKKREVGDIQKQITSIVCSGDKSMITSEYTQQLAIKLKQLKNEISDLNQQLKPKDQDNTKLNITESISVLNDTIKQIKGNNNEKTINQTNN